MERGDSGANDGRGRARRGTVSLYSISGVGIGRCWEEKGVYFEGRIADGGDRRPKGIRWKKRGGGGVEYRERKF